MRKFFILAGSFFFMLVTLCSVGCNTGIAPPVNEEETYNTDRCVGFCVMPMQIEPPDFAPKITVEENGYFKPRPYGKSTANNTKWPSYWSESYDIADGSISQYSYEYEIKINPRVESDEYYQLLFIYTDASGQDYTSRLDSVFCLPLGCSAVRRGKTRIDTGNSLPEEYFYYTVSFLYE